MAFDITTEGFAIMDWGSPTPNPGLSLHALSGGGLQAPLWLYPGIQADAGTASGTRRQRQIKSLIRTKRRGRRCRWLPRGTGNGHAGRAEDLF